MKRERRELSGPYSRHSANAHIADLALAPVNDGVRNNTPRDAEHAGHGFLMREGYAVLWTGWSGEIQDDNTGRLLGGLPVAKNADGSAVTGKNHVEITVDEPVKSRAVLQSPWGISAAYPAVSLDDAEAILTKRPDRNTPATEVPREATGDPRPSLDELYPDRGAYLDAVAANLIVLREGGYLLDEDVTRLLGRAVE